MADDDSLQQVCESFTTALRSQPQKIITFFQSFQGMPGENINQSSIYFSRTEQANGWSDYLKRKRVSVKLGHIAAQYDDRLSQEQRGSFDELVRNLKIRFSPSVPEEFGLVAVFSKYQTPHQSVDSFANQLLLHIHAVQSFNDQHRMKLATLAFV